MLKTCTGPCGQTKDVSEFTTNGKNADGTKKYRANCKVCQNEKAKDFYKNNIIKIQEYKSRPEVKEHRKEYAQEYHKEYYAKHPNEGYPMAIIKPKVEKIKEKYNNCKEYSVKILMFLCPQDTPVLEHLPILEVLYKLFRFSF